MWANVAVFYDSVKPDGWAKASRIHHNPSKLDADALVGSVICGPGDPPEVKDGWTAGLWVKPETGDCEWRVAIARGYRMPAADFLGLLPSAARVGARAAAQDDPVIADFLALLDMTVADNASSGIHPGSMVAKDGLSYLVSLGLLTQAEADAITEA